MRFLASAGMRLSHSGLGTTPNMAPPARRWSPAPIAQQRSFPTENGADRAMRKPNASPGDLVQVFPGGDPRGFRALDQLLERLRRHQRVAPGAVPPVGLEAEEVHHRI